MKKSITMGHATLDIAKRYAAEIQQKYPVIVEAMRNKVFRAVETGVHPKTIADWNRMGLLLAPRQRNKHHRFTMTEFVWILILDRMRGFNLSYELIAAFRMECIQPQSFSFDDILSQPSFVDQLSKALPDIPKDWLTGFFADTNSTGLLNDMLSKDFPIVSTLDTLILVTLFMESPVSIIMDDVGRGSVLYPELFRVEGLDASDLEKLLYSTHVSISLSEMVAKAMGAVPTQKLTGELKLLSDQEAKVLDVLREEGLRSVTVRFDGRGEMEFLELTSDQKVDKRARLLELMLTTGYQDITVKTQNGDVVFCQNTRKIKLK